MNSSLNLVDAKMYSRLQRRRFMVTTMALITTVAPRSTGKFRASVARLIHHTQSGDRENLILESKVLCDDARIQLSARGDDKARDRVGNIAGAINVRQRWNLLR